MLRSKGLILIQHVAGDASVTDVASLFAPVMETFYGRSWDVISVPDAKNIAYTSQELGWHQDLLYFESPPGLQFLKCIKAAETGGETLFLDGRAAAERFATVLPGDATELSKCPIRYGYSNMGVRLYVDRPVLSRSREEIWQVWWAPPWREGFDVRKVDVSVFVALERWQTFLRNFPSLSLKLEPGQVVVFDNHRILHGRRAFTGDRHLQGCYISRDSFRSCFNDKV